MTPCVYKDRTKKRQHNGFPLQKPLSAWLKLASHESLLWKGKHCWCITLPSMMATSKRLGRKYKKNCCFKVQCWGCLHPTLKGCYGNDGRIARGLPHWPLLWNFQPDNLSLCDPPSKEQAVGGRMIQTNFQKLSPMFCCFCLADPCITRFLCRSGRPTRASLPIWVPSSSWRQIFQTCWNQENQPWNFAPWWRMETFKSQMLKGNAGYQILWEVTWLVHIFFLKPFRSFLWS